MLKLTSTPGDTSARANDGMRIMAKINANSEAEFLKQYNRDKYEKPSVAVDVAVFTIEDNRLKVLLVEREAFPDKGLKALIGVFVGMSETLDEAAKRALKQKAGVENIYSEQLYTWGALDRDPRMRIISVSYFSLVPREKLHLGEDTTARLCDVDELLSSDEKLAFDHKKIIAYARERIKNKCEYTQIAFELVGEEFTLPNLQRVYEILLGKPLYKANFRRKIAPLVEETERETCGDCHRPSRIYVRKSVERIERV